MFICMVMDCRSGRTAQWIDTQGRDRNIPMWKDPNLILDYENFWSQNELLKDYVVPKVVETSIAQYEKGLEVCIPRIEGCRTRQRAKEIIGALKVSSYSL
jgi:hypothetical protein